MKVIFELLQHFMKKLPPLKLVRPNQLLTFAICEVAYAEDVVGIWVMVLFNKGSFLWGVLQLHRHFLQLFVQLFKQNKKGCTLLK